MKITNNNGGIRIQFWVNGTRYSLTPIKGGKFDSASDLAKAQEIARVIEGDIKASLFDPSLERYRVGLAKLADRAKETSAKLERMAKIRAEIDLKELWERYQRFKKPMVSPTTYSVDFVRRVGGTIAKLPTLHLKDAIAIRDWLVQHKTPAQARKILTQFNAAANWGVESGLIDRNPFEGMARKIKVGKSDGEINPFTSEERDRLLAVCQNKHPHYAPLLKFLFYSGCRPSEAIALRIADRKADRLTFRQSFVEGKVLPRLKTQKSRTIRINAQLGTILDEAIALVDTIPKPHGLLFPSPRGEYLDWHNFTNRVWRTLFADCPNIQYRNPYQTRATFITEAIKAGVSIQDIAKHCGNSAKVIWTNYAGISRNFEMPHL